MNFTIDTIPYGIYSVDGSDKRLATAIGNKVVDLSILAENGLIAGSVEIFKNEYLNDFIALGKERTNAIRKQLQTILANPDEEVEKAMVDMEKVEMHLPVKIGDYTDFYSSEQHAYNVGSMFRDPERALNPNWKHLPVGYHGRSSSIYVSGTPFRRPSGQVKPKDADRPHFSACKRLDFELEMGTVIGKSNSIGDPISVNEAEEYVFGFQLFNDWSARDIQSWEYVPLGPFLGKSFFSSVAAWVIPIEALEPFRVNSVLQDPEVLHYLKGERNSQFDVSLEVELTTKEGLSKVITRSNFKHLYWTVAQQIAHHTINGCNLQIGDLLASGTISGTSPDSFGSLLELSWNGSRSLDLGPGVERTFLEDGDTVIMRGFAEKDGVRVDFGEVRNTVLPAKTIK